MSEPIMGLVGEYARAVEGGTGAQVEAAQAAIEREVAALREQLRIQDEANDILTKRLEEAKADVAALVSRKIDLEAERAALMEAGHILAVALTPMDTDFAQYHPIDRDAAYDVFMKPGALAAWMGREGR